MPVITTISSKSVRDINADLLILFVYAGEKIAIPGTANGVLADVTKKAKEINFTGVWGSSELFAVKSDDLPSFIGIVGLGDRVASQERQSEGVRRGVGRLVGDARRHLLHHIAVVLDDEAGMTKLVDAVMEGVDLSNYRFSEHRPALAKEQKARAVRKVTFVTDNKDVQKNIKNVQTIMEGVTLTRDLVNEPPSHNTPKTLVDRAREIAKLSPDLSVKVLNRAQAEKQGFTAFLAVAKGSTEEPYVIHLQYKPKKKATGRVSLVGKGITFDSGGLSLKPSGAMEDMKIDMAGAATVLGVFQVISHLNLPIHVDGIIAACENMPSGTAYRPGDVVRAKNGKTIEILNTDAEGRVTLADALTYAVEQKPNAVIDMATLTGASMIALGDTYAGLWSNSDILAQQLLRAAEATGEGLTHMPLPDEYRQTIQSRVADVRNTATMERMGGAITAALFLQEFVGNAFWAHMDIAGPVYMSRQLLPYYMHGATGYGVRTIVRFLQEFEAVS